MTAESHVTPSPTRRTLMKGAAWSIPVIAAAVATPLAASSTIDVGAFALRGTCGIVGFLGPGFTLQAGPTAALPVGTTVIVSGSGIANIGVFSVSGGTASVAVLGGTARLITLTASLPAGTTIAFRSTLSLQVAFTLTAVAAPPAGVDATGAKAAANVSSTLTLCSAN